jgi:hypothetical protein
VRLVLVLRQTNPGHHTTVHLVGQAVFDWDLEYVQVQGLDSGITRQWLPVQVVAVFLHMRVAVRPLQCTWPACYICMYVYTFQLQAAHVWCEEHTAAPGAPGAAVFFLPVEQPSHSPATAQPSP